MRTVHPVNSRNPDNVDIISTLPDELCGHIVSFLSMKEAVATSVLSQRWCYVWASSPALDFDFSLIPRTRGRKATFVRFVGRAIELFEGSLQRFRVSLEGYEGHEPKLDEWVAFAVDRNAEEIELCLPKGRLVRIPDKIFKCGSLRVLRLKMCHYLFELPSPEALAMLKKLHLVSVSLMKGKFMKELFANCLILEDLVIKECKIDVFEVVAPRLKSLMISNCYWIHPVQIKILATSLLSFSYSGRMADDHCIENLTSLNEASLDLSAPSTLHETEDDSKLCLINLYQALSNARSLTLSSWCNGHLSRAPRLLKCLQSGGVGVRELVLGVWHKEDTLRVIRPWLRCFPNLEILEVHIHSCRSIQKGPYCDGAPREGKRSKGATMNLKSVKLVHVDKCKNGIELVKYLLRNARGLEKMSIVPFADGLEYAMFRRRVSALREASHNVNVEYCVSA